MSCDQQGAEALLLLGAGGRAFAEQDAMGCIKAMTPKRREQAFDLLRAYRTVSEGISALAEEISEEHQSLEAN